MSVGLVGKSEEVDVVPPRPLIMSTARADDAPMTARDDILLGGEPSKPAITKTPPKHVAVPPKAVATARLAVDFSDAKMKPLRGDWQHYFGVGLVKTPEDFGSQGTRPLHPEVLDLLAYLLAEGNSKHAAFQHPH